MTRLRRALLCVALAVAPSAVRAQSVVRIELPPGDPFPAAPEILVRAESFNDTLGPFRVRLRLALDAGFGLVVYDSTQTGIAPRFMMIKLLPENREIFAEATVFDRNGVAIGVSRPVGPVGRTGPRLRLVSPTGSTNVSVPSRRPTFAWRSAPVTDPPGPWVYELFITNVGRQETRSQLGITDTVFTITDSLEAQTSYRWKVIARLANGLATDSAVASSPSTFVVSPSDTAVTTLLYQTFPNPFPAPSSAAACVWFDLHQRSRVELTVYDIRGNRVRTLIPGLLPAELPAGRYGRLSDIDASGCDPRLTWDGTADNGRTVRAGVYLLRLKTDSGLITRKIVYLGPR